jgi:hypothetical protein
VDADRPGTEISLRSRFSIEVSSTDFDMNSNLKRTTPFLIARSIAGATVFEFTDEWWELIAVTVDPSAQA